MPPPWDQRFGFSFAWVGDDRCRVVVEDRPASTATVTHALGLVDLEDALVHVFAATEPHGGEYDGWGAPVIPRPARRRRRR